MWRRRESSLLHEKTSSSLNPPALTDARNIPCINRARGRLCSCGFEADNNSDTKVFLSLHSHPRQHASGLRAKHMDLFTTMVQKRGKARILELMFLVHGKIRESVQSVKPQKLHGQRIDDATEHPKELWILKDYVAHNLHLMPMFSSCAEHSVLFCSKAESKCMKGGLVDGCIVRLMEFLWINHSCELFYLYSIVELKVYLYIQHTCFKQYVQFPPPHLDHTLLAIHRRYCIGKINRSQQMATFYVN